jgi:hypothetical protein
MIVDPACFNRLLCFNPGRFTQGFGRFSCTVVAPLRLAGVAAGHIDYGQLRLRTVRRPMKNLRCQSTESLHKFNERKELAIRQCPTFRTRPLMYDNHETFAAITGAQILPAQLTLKGVLEFADAPAFRDLYLYRDLGIRSARSEHHVRLFRSHGFRFALDRIGISLAKAHPIGDPGLHCRFVRKVAERCALGKIAVQEIMLKIFDALDRKQLELTARSGRTLKSLLETQSILPRPRRQFGVRRCTFVRQR